MEVGTRRDGASRPGSAEDGTVQGRTHRLGLNVVVLEEAADWLERQRAVWDRMFDAVEYHLEAQRGADR